jgi:hypothetical protein
MRVLLLILIVTACIIGCQASVQPSVWEIVPENKAQLYNIGFSPAKYEKDILLFDKVIHQKGEVVSENILVRKIADTTVSFYFAGSHPSMKIISLPLQKLDSATLFNWLEGKGYKFHSKESMVVSGMTVGHIIKMRKDTDRDSLVVKAMIGSYEIEQLYSNPKVVTSARSASNIASDK